MVVVVLLLFGGERVSTEKETKRVLKGIKELQRNDQKEHHHDIEVRDDSKSLCLRMWK